MQTHVTYSHDEEIMQIFMFATLVVHVILIQDATNSEIQLSTSLNNVPATTFNFDFCTETTLLHRCLSHADSIF